MGASADEHVLIVGAGTGILARHRPDCRTSVMCQVGAVSSLHPLGLQRHTAVIALTPDTSNDDWVAMARALHDRDPFTRIAVFGEPDQRRAAAIGAALGLAAHPPSVVDAVCDKSIMRRMLADAGVENVRWTKLDSAEALARWVREHPGDWIVKPYDGSASAGVAVLNDESAAPDVYRRCVTAEHFGDQGAPTVLVEEFLPGQQVSVEAISEGGEHCVVAVTRKYSDPRTYVELGHVVPADLPAEPYRAVADHAVRVLDALGIRNGLTHTEVVLTAHGPRTIETHLRMAGDEILDLVHGHTGVDLMDCQIRQLFGETVLAEVRERLRQPRGPAQAIWFGVPPAPGTLIRMEGLDEATEVDPSVEVRSLVADGAELGELDSSQSRTLRARASGPDPDTAIRRAVNAVARCRLVLSFALPRLAESDEVPGV